MKISAIETKNEYGLSFVEIRGCEEFETAHVFECVMWDEKQNCITTGWCE